MGLIRRTESGDGPVDNPDRAKTRKRPPGRCGQHRSCQGAFPGWVEGISQRVAITLQQ